MTNLKKLEKSPDLVQVDLLVRKYLCQYPPTLGHGYSHLKRVARIAWQLAIENKFNDPKIAYIAGLLHDLYRPARGEAGQEKHEEMTATMARKLLKESSFAKETKKIIAAMSNHDKIISIADKTEMSSQRMIAYSWASNRSLRGKGTIPYTNFRETLRDFCLYQVKAWNIFLAIRIKGMERAVEAYLQTNEDLIRAVRSELRGKTRYAKDSLAISRKEAKRELEYLQEAGSKPEEIEKIAANFQELVCIVGRKK